MYSGKQSKHVPNPSSFVTFEQNTASFVASAAATSFASIVDCTVSPCIATLKLTGSIERKTMYEDIDLPLSGLLPQFTSEKAVNLKPFSYR